MKRSSWIMLAILVLIVGAILAALFRQAASGPTFRPGDHATLADCMAAIPAAWGPGSLERSGAEDACRYVHAPARGPR